jgi:ankyrin repeat protein
VVPGRHEEILNSLNFEQIDARKLIIKAAHSKTCRWFLKHPDYLLWIDPQQVSQHHGFLWIRGKPGAGKSTIMKFIYSESKKKDRKNQSLTASFFFNARGELLERTVSGMYRSLLLQLFQGFPDLECVLDDPDLLPRNQSGCPPFNVLKDLLRAAVAKLGQRSFRCFIDALDECDEQQVMDLVEYFEDLAEQCTENNVNLHICFSSRHYPYIDIKFGIRIVLEEQIGHASDLESYIKTHLRIKDRPLLTELQVKMLEKAAGVFLWVVLVVDILNKENCRGRLAMKRRLEQVPSGLSDLFKDLLKRDTANMEELQLSLLWILLSERPLKPEEYYHAIWSGLYLEGLADFDIPEVDTEDSEDCFARCVISSSKGLAEITKVKQPRVQFIHESVRDFLIKDKGLHELWPELGPDWESVGHERLKLCCYSYFDLVTRKQQIDDSYLDNEELLLGIEIYPFLKYASQSVLHHANSAANIAEQQSFLENFRTSAWKRVVNKFEKHKVRKYSPTAALLYILADRGYSSLIRTRLKNDANIDIPSDKDRYVYPLIAAMAKGHKDSVAALLGFSSQDHDGIAITKSLLPNVDAGGSARSPFSWACEHGQLEIVELLAARGAQRIDENRGGCDPLILASKNGHTAIARWLIDHGVDIHARYKNESPITLASSNGHAETVEFLLNAGADPNTYGVRDQHILCLAARNCHEAVVKVLLERRASVETKTGYYKRTPLELAAGKKGSKTTMEILLAHGADINGRDPIGETALFRAVRWASVDEIEFLIRSGADVNARNKADETCLHKAITGRKTPYEVVRVLLGNGARVDARTTEGRTCLHYFAHYAIFTPSTGDMLQLLASYGADFDSSDIYGHTPLHLMLKFCNPDKLSIFTNQPRLNINACDHLGKTPLHLAVLGTESREKAAILIEKGADINCQDNEGRTPLDDAVEGGSEQVVQFMKDKGGRRGVT